MSLYNMVHGMNSMLVVMASPFLPRRADNFPRFRDIFTGADDTDLEGDLYIYTRMGGGNRGCWGSLNNGDCCSLESGELCAGCDADHLEAHEQCVGRYEDTFDNTYCTFVWRVKDEHRVLFGELMGGKLKPIDAPGWYMRKIREMFPKLFTEDYKAQAVACGLRPADEKMQAYPGESA